MAHTILIVDDNLAIRRALCELFELERDFQVCAVAENGREGVKKALESHPDLILMDLMMPVMNGLDAARILKQLVPAVPIIMYSAFSDPFTEKEARSAGVCALVSKSERLSVLLSKARSLVDQIAA
jgi:DNA-binding NarL/FixJ family response regulator